MTLRRLLFFAHLAWRRLYIEAAVLGSLVAASQVVDTEDATALAGNAFRWRQAELLKLADLRIRFETNPRPRVVTPEEEERATQSVVL